MGKQYFVTVLGTMAAYAVAVVTAAKDSLYHPYQKLQTSAQTTSY